MVKRAPNKEVGRRTQLERSQATTQRLVVAARNRFALHGFAATSLDDILEQAGMTRGALYHHFESKTDLFRAVVEDQERALTQHLASAAQGQTNAWRAFRAGCSAFLEACLDPKVQRLLLIDGPAVLGWEEMRTLESRYTWALMRGGLERAMAEGHIPSRPVEPLTHLLVGALSQAAMAIARAKDPALTMRDTRREVERLLEALAAR